MKELSKSYSGIFHFMCLMHLGFILQTYCSLTSFFRYYLRINGFSHKPILAVRTREVLESTSYAKMELDAGDDVGDNYLGLYEVVIHAQTFGALLVTFLAERGQHNNLQIGSFRGIA